MADVKRMILDVLKPHQPNALEFTNAIANTGSDYHVRLTVLGVDENTDTLQIEIQGNSINFEEIETTISSMGGSLHSIDEVEVHSKPNVE